MSQAIFIAGTDTGIGKSVVSATLLAALNANGHRAVGMKPVASGCRETAQGLRNEDAELLIAHSADAPHYAQVNPFALPVAIAPHLAAAHAGVEVRLDPIVAAFAALSTIADFVVVEGVGGWMVPLSDTLMQADLVRALRLPVILVVGLRLGCLNHAQLSARAIIADGCKLVGWIGNRVDPAMDCVEANIATLRARLPVPCLGVVPFASTPDPCALAPHLRATAVALATTRQAESHGPADAGLC
ncbi:MAG TPA: dethiobiotin synthase [Rudaea sp.]|nr:dethiobiotin synthase [Rudaea sp.]